ncbi:hypothetical protein ACFV9Z_20905 [Streptomyces sp. NPDC059883]|uniref:hypothetical protein n=1 Tax=unclassified Streptomyces TaxID=2593676 RepID=UPI0036654A64
MTPESMPRLYSTMTGDPFSSSPIELIRPPTWRLGGEQSDQLVPPSADGGLGHVVAIGHVGQALVVRCTARTIDHPDPSRRQEAPPGHHRLQMAPQQIGELVDGARGKRQTALTGKRAGASE